MKQIRKNKCTVYDVTYQCEVCGEISWSSDKIKICEKSHNCDHRNLHYKFTELEDIWLSHVTGIKCVCEDCGKKMGHCDFEGEEQGVLEKIYNIYTRRENNVETANDTK